LISYYDVLGIPGTADEQAITAAYRAKAQASLTDAEAYDLVQLAFETLKSPEKRQQHDAELIGISPEKTQQVTTSIRSGTVPLRRAVSPLVEDSDKTQAFQPVTCAVCTHQNVSGEIYCAECGFLLSSAVEKSTLDPLSSDVPSGPRLESATGHVYPLKAGLNRVGRENADVLVLDKTVSRYHAMLVFDEERHIFSVEDAGSSNGTRVNDSLLAPRSSHQLSDSDEVSFGNTRFRLISGLPARPAEKGGLQGRDDQEVEITLPPSEHKALARLTLQRGRGPQEVLLVPGSINIGRLPDNQISLTGDRYASGHHAQIVVEENIFRLIDVGSTNGSFLNGLRLTTNESIAINDGDEIMIGSTVFQFQKVSKDQPFLEPDEEEKLGDELEEPVALVLEPNMSQE
jgi:pSer/pThr/pTyr-binding forkhead associated (FHA) protein